MNVLLCTLALFYATTHQVETSKTADTLLYIRTVPSGAQILLNGKPLGNSDGLFPVKPGQYKIVVDLEGHEPHNQEITIVNGKIKRFELVLKQQSALKDPRGPEQPQGGLGGPIPNSQFEKAAAISRVEVLANRMVSATNLSGIGKAMLIYANDHDDQFPPHLDALVRDAELHPKLLVSPRKPEGFAGPDYIYVAGQDISMHPTNVIAYENPAYCQDGINVLYLDSHVAWEKREEFLKALAATHKRLGRPMPSFQFKRAGAISQVEVLANRMKSATQLSGMGKAMLIYANDHDDVLPPSLETLVREAELHPKQLVSPSKPEGFAGPDYVYVAGQKANMHPNNVVAFENPAYCQDGLNVLYLDSHVAWEKPDDFLVTIEAMRRRLGRPLPKIQFKGSGHVEGMSNDIPRSEVLANRMKSATQLSGMGKAMLIYANDHDDVLPPNLQALVSEVHLLPSYLASPSKPIGSVGPSYVYIAGQTALMDPRNVVAYENPAYCQDGINVLYLDTHVVWEQPDEFMQALAATYKRLGRPMPTIQFENSDSPEFLGPEDRVFELIIQDLDEGKGHEALDLDTGKQYDISVHGDGQGGSDIMHQLVSGTGVDLLADYASNRWALMTSDLTLKRYIPNEFWDRLGPAEVQTLVSLPQEANQGIEILDRSGFRFYILDRGAKAPQTFAFETGEGTLGMLQITEFRDRPRSIKIRYRLVKQ